MLLFAHFGAATPIYYLATGQTGAQTQIDLNHTSSWVITPNIDFGFNGGLFTMKDGSSSFADQTLSVYKGSDATGVLLRAITLKQSVFCGQAGNCGQFSTHQFLFSSTIPLVAGTTYFAALTSSAADMQSQAYFIKNDSYFISDQNGVMIQPQPAAFGAPMQAVPEPGPFELLGISAAFMYLRSRSGKKSRRHLLEQRATVSIF